MSDGRAHTIDRELADLGKLFFCYWALHSEHNHAAIPLRSETFRVALYETKKSGNISPNITKYFSTSNAGAYPALQDMVTAAIEAEIVTPTPNSQESVTLLVSKDFACHYIFQHGVCEDLEKFVQQLQENFELLQLHGQ